MSANPIELIGGLANTSNVVKADIVAWGKGRVAQVLANATEIRNTVLAGQLVVVLKSNGATYAQDTADTTTADDGVTCIISLDGKRFKPTSGVLPPGVSANVLNTVIADYTVQTTDAGKTIQAGTGSTGLFNVTLPSVSGFASNAVVTIVNSDTARGKRLINFPSGTNSILWPLQSITVEIVNGVWTVSSDPGRWKLVGGALNVYADFTNGSDTNDGLAPGVGGAKKSAENALLEAYNSFDWSGSAIGQSTVVVRMAANTADTVGVHLPVHAFGGAQGGAAVQLRGATLPVTGAANNGSGLIRLLLSSTASYTTGNSVAVTGVGGTVEANAVWKITVIDGTHIDLQGSTFTNAYTSGGTVSNGSSLNVTGADAIAAYFGSVFQIYDLTLNSTQNNLSMLWGSKAYLSGVIFGGTPLGTHIHLGGLSQIEVVGPIGISGSAGDFVVAESGSLRMAASSLSITENVGFAGGFIFASGSGVSVDFTNTVISLHGNTVTGKRFSVGNGASIYSGPRDGTLTYFPGDSAGTFASAGQYDSLTTNANLTGDVTSVGNATTLTNAPVIAKVLTGYVSGAGTLTATDSILGAFQKLNGNDQLLAPKASPTFTGTANFATIIASSSGSFGVTTGAQWGGLNKFGFNGGSGTGMELVDSNSTGGTAFGFTVNSAAIGSIGISNTGFTFNAVGGKTLTFQTNNSNTLILDTSNNAAFQGNVTAVTSISATTFLKCGSFTVAGLPAGSTGAHVWASNCRVFNGAGVQEGAAAGTGGLVTYNGSAWKIAGTNVTAVA